MNKKQLRIISQIRFTCPITKKKIACRKDSKISMLLCDNKIQLDEAIQMLKKCHIRHNMTNYDDLCESIFNSLIMITSDKSILYNLTKDISRSIVDVDVYNIYYNKYKVLSI